MVRGSNTSAINLIDRFDLKTLIDFVHRLGWFLWNNGIIEDLAFLVTHDSERTKSASVGFDKITVHQNVDVGGDERHQQMPTKGFHAVNPQRNQIRIVLADIENLLDGLTRVVEGEQISRGERGCPCGAFAITSFP